MPPRLTVATLVVLALLMVALVPPTNVRYTEGDPSYNRAYWEQTIRTQGDTRAYELFIQKNSTESEVRQHFAAHVMGMALYTVRSVEGLAACDASFGFGCYHGFFAHAIASGDTEQIQKLDAVCEAKYGTLGTGCRHGIGHGILDYVGYDRVSDALSLCETETEQVAPLLGCTSGVFMEYLSPLEGDAPAPRPLDPENPYAPCTQIDSQFENSCYFELGQWLHRTQPDSTSRCEALTGKAHTHCFLGIGSDRARLVQDTKGLVDACRSVSPEDERACRAGALWHLFSSGHRVEASALCGYADSSEREACVSLADLTEGRDPNFPS